MAKILDMPKLSPTMEEGVLQTWHKREGDSVNVDDLLAEVETDKATMEFRAFDKGTLRKILVPAGTNVKLGQAVAILGDANEDISAALASLGASAGGAGSEPAAKPAAANATPPKAPDVAPPSLPVAAPADASPVAASPRPMHVTRTKGDPLARTQRDDSLESLDLSVGSESASGLPAQSSGRILASPYVRKVARERGIDLATTPGSGQFGRILPADIEAAAVRPSEPVASPASMHPANGSAGALEALRPAPEVRPLTPMRKTIARRLTQSKQTVPHFYLTIDVNAGALVRMRETINAELAQAGKSKGAANADANADGSKPDKISLNDLLIKAVATALRRVPEANAQFTDEALVMHRRIDISVAVAVADGLVTPVVRDADTKSVVAIARDVRELATRARAKKLKPEEMSDGTFSISNLGMFGIDEFAAVINPPEGAILAVGQVRSEPVVFDGAIVAGHKMALTLSCDHRVIDGAVGATFLAELRALLEHPMRILTG